MKFEPDDDVREARPSDRAKRVGAGACFLLFPLVRVFAFAAHPRLLAPKELIARAHHDGVLPLAPALVTRKTALLVVLTLHFIKLRDRAPTAWAGVGGGSLAVPGLAC